jgi:hypothetical protein
MARYNKKRKAEFKSAMEKYEGNDQLAIARIAFVNGTATAEQIAMVEEATAIARASGFKLPPLLPPAPHAEAGQIIASQPQSKFKVPALSTGTEADSPKSEPIPKSKQTWRDWWFSSLKKEEEGEDIGSSEKRLGWESLSDEDSAAGVRDSDLVRAIEEKAAFIKERTKAAFEAERENQRRGGALDQVGVEKATRETPKRGWW